MLAAKLNANRKDKKDQIKNIEKETKRRKKKYGKCCLVIYFNNSFALGRTGMLYLSDYY